MVDETTVENILTAIGTSGIATIVVAWITARTSGHKQDQAKPNGERQRLQDEVHWLRGELEREHRKD